MDKNQGQSQQLQNQSDSQSMSTSSALLTQSQAIPYVKTSKNHTFSVDTIVPIIRTVKVNQYCFAVYSTLHKTPLAVHQFLDKTVMLGTATRENKDFYKQTQGVEKGDQKFYVDPSYYERTNAYKTMSYDKGHMAPAKNYCAQQRLMDSTYTYVNCIPQNSYFNRGSWKNLQSYCRNLIRQDICETIQIISGPVFYSGLTYKGHQNLYQNQQVVMLQNGIVVPPKCYKIIKANKGATSYVSAFVLDNQKKKDNNIKVINTVVPVSDLQFMTGLRFKLGNYQPLEKLDPTGMAKTFGDWHLQFYTKLFTNAKNIGDMNNARKQGFTYYVSVDIKSVPTQDKIKMAENDYQITVKQVGWTRTKAKARRKINTLMGLHKDCKELDCLTKQLDEKITQTIRDNLQGAKNEDEKQYSRYITGKLYKNNYGYHYPCQQELKAIFPNPSQKQVHNGNQNNNQVSQQSIIIHQMENLTLDENSTPKTVKSPQKTPKKQKQEEKQSPLKEQSSLKEQSHS